MKKYVFTLLFSLACIVLSFAQIDSTDVQTLAHTGVQILTLTNNTIIPNVPNEITGGIISGLIAIVWRFFEKRKLRKAGKLVD